jgi:hypothetical protein
MVICSNTDQDMTATAGLWSTNENFHGIVISNTGACWYNKTLTGIKIKLKKEGADSSDLYYFRIYDSSGTLQASSDGQAQSSLSTSMTEIDLAFTSGTTYTTQVGDRIGIWYDGGSSSAGKIRAQKSNSVTSYENTTGAVYQGGWFANQELGYVKESGDAPTPGGDTLLFPPQVAYI